MTYPINKEWDKQFEKFFEKFFDLKPKGESVMKGRNQFILNEATMKEIVDRYFEDIMYSKHKDFEVALIRQEGDSFVVIVSECEVKE